MGLTLEAMLTGRHAVLRTIARDITETKQAETVLRKARMQPCRS